jgi:uncharacterized protein (DUF488 family)
LTADTKTNGYICIMFYRRKVILSLLQLFEGKLEKIRLQKLLFLITQHQTKPEYDFIPYKYGCYSYSANADLTAMANKGLLIETETAFEKSDSVDYIKALKAEDSKLVHQVKKLYGAMNANTLMKHTYVNFPYYAINSVKANEILNREQLSKIIETKPFDESTVLFTIGYESISLEEYLNRLIKNNVKVLVDVRRNPLSMKYGFSKNQLKKYCSSLGIEYIHFPEVGIRSEERQELNTQSDYDRLFTHYRMNELLDTKDTQQKILELLINHKRIALTCFEKDICQCHRKHLAEAITAMPDFKYHLRHI